MQTMWCEWSGVITYDDVCAMGMEDMFHTCGVVWGMWYMQCLFVVSCGGVYVCGSCAV